MKKVAQIKRFSLDETKLKGMPVGKAAPEAYRQLTNHYNANIVAAMNKVLDDQQTSINPKQQANDETEARAMIGCLLLAVGLVALVILGAVLVRIVLTRP